MKKSLIALAVLAASGASFAQSSVTISGTFDPSFASQKTTYVDGDSVTQNFIRNNSQGTSNVTFKGVEDLGGGLKASFLIENDFTAAEQTGKTNSLGYAGGEVYTGLEGSFGAIKLGAPNTPTLTAQAASQPFGTKIGGGFGIANSGKVRNNNTVLYATPAMNGFSAAVAYSNKTKLDADAATAITTSTADITDFGVNYANGPVAAGFSIYKVGAVVGLNPGASKTDNNVYVTYDMGVAKLGAGYYTQKQEATVDAKGYNVSAAVPLSANLSLLANFAKLDDNMVANKDRQVSAVGVKYTLSTRTSVYARYVAEKNDNAASIKEVTTALVGVQHNF